MDNIFRKLGRRWLLSLVAILLSAAAYAQQNIIIDLSPVDGIDLNSGNILKFRLQPIGNAVGKALITGTVRYRNSPLSFSYSFRYDLKPGVNTIDAGLAHPQWQFSSPALRDLFFNYKTLPEGTYEYCVTASPVSVSGEVSSNVFEECLYRKSDGIFLINLLEPENKARIKEYNPMLSWVANYSFASELTYRIRVAEIKQGQNPSNAVSRNQPLYEEKNLMQNSIVYPIYARPLKKNQPYAWTVDAYYRGILLGGAETWQFIIVDDSVMQGSPANKSYIDVKKENGSIKQFAVGELKIKYVLENFRKDTLNIMLMDKSNKPINIHPNVLTAVYGDNRYNLDLQNGAILKHSHEYRLFISTMSGAKYVIPFEYINPDFIK